MISATKLFLGSIPAMALFMGTSAVTTTGDYHHGTSLKCYQCHTMHYSQQHQYDSAYGQNGGDPFGGFATTGGPFEYLLRGEVNDLCLECHDEGDDKDVLGLDGGAYTNGRLAGALNADAASGHDVSAEGYNWWAGHTLGSTAAAPGATTWTNDNGLDCIDCHHQHGYTGYGDNRLVVPTDETAWLANGTYRNLIGGTRQITYATDALVNDTEYDVWQLAGAHSATHYDLNNVNYNQPDPNGGSAFADWCGQCHGNFHGAVGGAEIGGDASNHHFIRHPSAFVNVGGQSSGGHSNLSVWNNAAGDARVKALSSNGDWSVGTATDITPSCMSCHKSHGNKNEFGLIFVSKGDAATTMTEEGSANGSAYSTCANCHVQGV